MPMPRSLGGTNTLLSVSHTVTSAMTIRPDSGRSSPARQRSVVVFPQPDGPSSVISFPVSMPRLMPSTALTTTLPGATNVLWRLSTANMTGPTRPLSSGCRLGGVGLRAPFDAQFKPPQAGDDDDERDDLDDAERRDGAVAAALLPHREA